MSAALLDVNVLVALFDSLHPNHEDAHAWFGSHGRKGWATCPITLNGCIRVLSNPAYPSVTATPAAVAEHLRTLCAKPNHEFWPDHVSPLDEKFRMERVAGSKQITDIYLLGLAVANGGQLITFDRSIPWQAFAGAKASHLVVLG